MRWRSRPRPTFSGWTYWIAWRPVITEDGYWVWLELIERRYSTGAYGDVHWCYRLLEAQS